MKGIKGICMAVIVAALYIVLTFINPLSFGPINFRISNILYGLTIQKRDLRIGLIIGMFLANLYSPFGIVDAILGVSTALFACYLLQPCFKSYLVQAILYGIFSGALVGYELFIFTNTPIIFAFISVAIGNIISYYVGAYYFKYIMKYLRRIF